MKRAIELLLALFTLAATAACSVADHDKSAPKATTPAASSTTVPGPGGGSGGAGTSCAQGTAAACGIASCAAGSTLVDGDLAACRCAASNADTGANSCEAAQAAQVKTLNDATAAASAAARDKALQAQSLSAQTLKGLDIADKKDGYCQAVEGWPAAKPCPPLEGNPTTFDEGASYSFKDGATTYTFVVGRRFGGCGRGQDFAFAKSAAGAIVIVEDKPQPQIVATHKFCGCAPYSGCGGEEFPDSQEIYLLPQGVTFGGKVENAFSYDATKITYDDLDHDSPDAAGGACAKSAPP
jgi:hypothetical protein